MGLNEDILREHMGNIGKSSPMPNEREERLRRLNQTNYVPNTPAPNLYTETVILKAYIRAMREIEFGKVGMNETYTPKSALDLLLEEIGIVVEQEKKVNAPGLNMTTARKYAGNE